MEDLWIMPKSETITDYEEFSKKFLEAALRENDQLTSPPVIVAEVIYEAITDNTDTLRYIAGEDAKQMISLREAMLMTLEVTLCYNVESMDG